MISFTVPLFRKYTIEDMNDRHVDFDHQWVTYIAYLANQAGLQGTKLKTMEVKLKEGDETQMIISFTHE